MTSRWFVRLRTHGEARKRLVCFPSAGAGASAFARWPEQLPRDVELWAVQLPGRETRVREPPVSDFGALTEEIALGLQPVLALPFAFFGHSMGAVLAFEVARALARKGSPTPGHLFVSARRPPRVPDSDSPMRHLADAEFVAEIGRRYGGIRAEVVEEKELLALLLPMLRADVTALETYRPVPGPPLACPIAVFGGSDDRRTPREHLEAWRGETTGAFRIRVFPGDHYYLTPHRADLLADLSAAMASLTGLAAREAVA